MKTFVSQASLLLQDCLWRAQGGNPRRIPEWRSSFASRLMGISDELLKTVGNKKLKPAALRKVALRVGLHLQGTSDYLYDDPEYNPLFSPSEKKTYLEVAEKVEHFALQVWDAGDEKNFQEMKKRIQRLAKETFSLSKSLDPNQILG
ncbi:MAG: hypothetical protein UX08_C0013G0021 [Candidatus Collierbacteria bacterium GW2011_GWB1_45_35]|nr:MAG: hypothetical protein UW48_C0008G0021 [Microgenomates group bacterium GW2011_GWC1_44_23]KKT95354.1 MAG: hypothetical protein UW96_C0008G0021 [Candidatus Collierbacteria bacterium GW2011_GWA1_45_15]KKT99595.1 MAG: hypothetical protein UX01_C0009G0025 [Candidatus Collierbacteria bacterium GW2011_GWB2_45_17]KKU04931.1 MAG: hypothetical protein UX08_C0013G0021 [Candidatus Collierbacteria bacterium GW2011_GWB1_45_35]KKU06979.1 MAG: hypothetical protein UX11_C0022G0012 [Candidatus Collierbacte